MIKKKLNLKELIANAEGLNTIASKGGGGRQTNSVSIVNCDNGKRVTLSAKLYAELGTLPTVQVAVDTKRLYISENLGKEDLRDYRVSHKTRGYIYCADLVEVITEKLNLDFSDRTSVSLSNVKVSEIDGYPCAIVKYSSTKDE